jgi:hypothetical protein
MRTRIGAVVIALLSFVGFAGITTSASIPQAAALTCDKINGFRPCVSNYNAEGKSKPNIIQSNFCAGDDPSGTITGNKWQCVRWIRVGGQAVQGPMGTPDGNMQGSFRHEAALAYACSYVTYDSFTDSQQWEYWPQGGIYHGLGLTPNGYPNGFCSSTYGSTWGQFAVRTSASPGDVSIYTP